MPHQTSSNVPKSFSLDMAPQTECIARWSGCIGDWGKGIEHILQLNKCDRPILPWFSHEIHLWWKQNNKLHLLYQGQHDFNQIPEFDPDHLAVLVCEKLVQQVLLKVGKDDPRLTWHQPFEPYEAAIEKLHTLAIREYLKRMSAYPESYDSDRQEKEFHLFEFRKPKRKRKWDLVIKSDKAILRRRQLPEAKGSEWWGELMYGKSEHGHSINLYAIQIVCAKTIASEHNLDEWKSHSISVNLLKKVRIGETRNKRGIVVKQYGYRHQKTLLNQPIELETPEFAGDRLAQILTHFLARDLLNQRYEQIEWEKNLQAYVEKIRSL